MLMNVKEDYLKGLQNYPWYQTLTFHRNCNMLRWLELQCVRLKPNFTSGNMLIPSNVLCTCSDKRRENKRRKENICFEKVRCTKLKLLLVLVIWNICPIKHHQKKLRCQHGYLQEIKKSSITWHGESILERLPIKLHVSLKSAPQIKILCSYVAL